MTNNVKVLVWLVGMVVIIPWLVYAHGETNTLKQKVDPYVVDVDYVGPKEPRAGEAVRFEFNLLDKDEKNKQPFVYVWGKISKGSTVLFSADMHFPEFGAPWMAYAFPAPGDYTLTVRYYDQRADLAEATFPITVGESEHATMNGLEMRSVGLGIVIGLVVGALLVRRKKNSKV